MEIKLSASAATINSAGKTSVLKWDNDTYTATGEQSGKAYRVLLDRKFNRYFLTVDGFAVMHDSSIPQETFTGVGACNILISSGYRGWYNMKDVKAYADQVEIHFAGQAVKLTENVRTAIVKPEVK